MPKLIHSSPNSRAMEVKEHPTGHAAAIFCTRHLMMQSKVKAEHIQRVLIFMQVFNNYFQLWLSSACLSEKLELPQAS